MSTGQIRFDTPNEHADHLIGVMLARALDFLSARVVMPTLIANDLKITSADQYDTVDVTVYEPGSPRDVVPSVTAPAPAARKTKKVQVSLDHWKYDDFVLTDEEIAKLLRLPEFIPRQLEMAVEGIAKEMNATIFSGYAEVGRFVGQAGQSPFQRGVTEATEVYKNNWAAVIARRELNRAEVPMEPRRIAVLDPIAEANLHSLPEFSTANQSGSTETQRTGGKWGRELWGFEWYWDNQVPFHEAGTPGGTPLVVGNHAVGATAVNIDGLTLSTGNYNAGDIVVFAGHDKQYAIKAAAVADGTGAVQIALVEPLKSAVADNASVTLIASHQANLAFHPNTFAFVQRTLSSSTLPGFTKFWPERTLQHPRTGLVMRLQVVRQHFQTSFVVDAMWGAKTIDPRLALRIGG